MLFSSKNVIQPNVTIEINGQFITCVNKTKFLGVIIDNKLTWKEHISYICGKVTIGIGIISKVRKYLNKNTLLDYILLIHISIFYLLQPGVGTFLSIRHECLGEVTKRAVRIISGVHPRTHTDPLYTELNLNCSNVMKLTSTWLVDSCIGYIMRI